MTPTDSNIERTVRRLGELRAVAILRTADEAAAAPALDAVVRAGFRAVEVTLGTPGALTQIERLAADERLTVGAGTVLTLEQARSCAAAGARFLVSPVTDESIVDEARRLGCAAVPGAATPTELWLAHRAGAPLQKLFPAPAAGPSWLRAVLGPMPFLRVVPTNGVDEHNARNWLEAGAVSVGLVSSLFAAEDMKARAFDRIEDRARRILASVA